MGAAEEVAERGEDAVGGRDGRGGGEDGEREGTAAVGAAARNDPGQGGCCEGPGGGGGEGEEVAEGVGGGKLGGDCDGGLELGGHCGEFGVYCGQGADGVAVEHCGGDGEDLVRL